MAAQNPVTEKEEEASEIEMIAEDLLQVAKPSESHNNKEQDIKVESKKDDDKKPSSAPQPPGGVSSKPAAKPDEKSAAGNEDDSEPMRRPVAPLPAKPVAARPAERKDDDQEEKKPSLRPSIAAGAAAGAAAAAARPSIPSREGPQSQPPTKTEDEPDQPKAAPAPAASTPTPPRTSPPAPPKTPEPARPAASTTAPRPAPKPTPPAKPAQPAGSQNGKSDGGIDWDLADSSSILNPSVDKNLSDDELRRRAAVIEQTLSSFGAPGRVVEVNHGPVITQFGVEPDYIEGRGGKRMRVKVGKIASLADDVALALAAPTIRIEAPVPGKGFVGIEVPNPEASVVGLRDVFDTEAFAKMNSPLKLALGKDVAGQPIVTDLTSMPHLLIAGTTGSGKSVCVNGIICTLLLSHTPDTLRFIMIDPKRVELTNYNGIPHLMAPVVTELERIVGVLKWVQREMDNRYRSFAMAGARNINDYNRRVDQGKIEDGERLPYIVVVVDELADLMMLAPDETERVLTRLAQMARATGIHIIISTQRPSVDVVTGLIKANFPARIAFAVATSVDSRVILDMPGADKLLGRGDMLFQAPDAPLPIRMQGVYLSDREIQAIVDHWKDQAKEKGFTSDIGRLEEPGSRGARRGGTEQSRPSLMQPTQAAFLRSSSDDDDETDDLYEEAVALVRDMKKASTSLLQRHLRIGYTRAARMIDLMEERGVIGPHEGGSKPRVVLDADGNPISEDDE
ncbi:MAG: DNA translocase FtsK [Chloroflexi bacterium]|nr:DNA translocase FtsK [Chloroflexota bacterium]